MSRAYAIRGATTISEDMPGEVISESVALMSEMLNKNKIGDDEIVSIIISTTTDIKSFYPARALREQLYITAPLFSCMEPEIFGALKLCIRILLTVQTEKKKFTPNHVYLKGAQNLRPDLNN